MSSVVLTARAWRVALVRRERLVEREDPRVGLGEGLLTRIGDSSGSGWRVDRCAGSVLGRARRSRLGRFGVAVAPVASPVGTRTVASCGFSRVGSGAPSGHATVPAPSLPTSRPVRERETGMASVSVPALVGLDRAVARLGRPPGQHESADQRQCGHGGERASQRPTGGAAPHAATDLADEADEDVGEGGDRHHARSPWRVPRARAPRRSPSPNAVAIWSCWACALAQRRAHESRQGEHRQARGRRAGPAPP